MPWLVKTGDDERRTGHDHNSESLLFVHVPRCGGTSLTQHFSVPRKTMIDSRSWWNRLGMRYFFHRYHVLETANFPIRTRETTVSLVVLQLSLAAHLLVLRGDDGGHRHHDNDYGEEQRRTMTMTAATVATLASRSLLLLSFLLFALPAFVFTAPVIGRNTYVRRSYLWLIHTPLRRFMESVEWCTGTNHTGYMMHLTARKLLVHGYVTPEEMDTVCSMAIVRNPYSRMVSVYMYNRYGSYESFEHFVRSWYALMVHYRERGETEEWYTPCHCLPQYEFTHHAGKQLVQSVVKQEELKYLKNRSDVPLAVERDSTVSDLPDPVRDALLGMPHTNSRRTDKKWWEYYDQETLNLTYQMYQTDFEVFGYDPKLDHRPDLRSPSMAAKVAAPPAVSPPPSPPSPASAAAAGEKVERMRRNSSMVAGRRVSRLLTLRSASVRGRGDLGSSGPSSLLGASLLSSGGGSWEMQGSLPESPDEK